MNSLLEYVQASGVRHLLPFEQLPLWEGVMMENPDPDWIWVYQESGVAKSAIVAAPVHGVVLLCRLVSWEKGNVVGILRLFREAARECRERGYTRFMTIADLERPVERQLLAIARRFGASDGGNYVLVAGKIPETL